MKRTFILSAAALFAVSIAFTSCKPSRVWATKDKEDRREKKEERREDRDDRYYEERDRRYDVTPPPPPPPAPSYYSSGLIISPTPGFVMNRYPDGRYYHRSSNGFLYWKGYDNRFYLDRSYLNRVAYSSWEYDEWKRYNRSSNNPGPYRRY